MSEKSMLEIAVDFVKSKKGPISFKEIADEVAKIRNYSEEQYVKYTPRLYNDITTSGVFVYCGESEWDLKARQSITLVDKDSSYFTSDEEAKDIKELLKSKGSAMQFHKSANPIDSFEALEEREEEETAIEFNDEPIILEEDIKEEVIVEAPKEKPVDIKVEEEITFEEEHEEEFTDEEEEEYNKIMDEYEDLYEEK